MKSDPFQTSPNIDPLNTNVPYSEKNFVIGFWSSVIHTSILIFFAELGDKTFIMLFILQLRTNKSTIFFSALCAEILMNIIACFMGFFIEYLLYKNLIDYLGILFFVIYGIFLILSGLKASDDTFEEEIESIEDMYKQRIKPTSSMILGVDEEEIQQLEKNNSKFNMEQVNKYNEKTYVPHLKKELTIVQECDISREDSTMNVDESLLRSNKKKNLEETEDDGEFILGKKGSSNFRLKLNKKKDELNSSSSDNSSKRVSSKKLQFDLKDSRDNNSSDNNIVIEGHDDNEDEDNHQEDENEDNRLRGHAGYAKKKSRYHLEYIDEAHLLCA